MVVARIARVEKRVEPPAKAVVTPSHRRPLADVSAEIRVQARSRMARVAKRAIDIVGSAAGLVTLAPVFAATALAVKATSRGPIFYVQDRCGLAGRLFHYYHFRTMVADAEDLKADLEHLNEMQGPVFKIARDPRITRLGAVLRKLSIDEMPQLLNVLKGDMSLVGPRPPMPCEVEQYTRDHAQRLAVVPGITGLWQVSGRSEINEFDRWLALDLEYSRTWSLWLDLRILAKTPFVVLTTRGAQ